MRSVLSTGGLGTYSPRLRNYCTVSRKTNKSRSLWDRILPELQATYQLMWSLGVQRLSLLLPPHPALCSLHKPPVGQPYQAVSRAVSSFTCDAPSPRPYLPLPPHTPYSLPYTWLRSVPPSASQPSSPPLVDLDSLLRLTHSPIIAWASIHLQEVNLCKFKMVFKCILFILIFPVVVDNLQYDWYLRNVDWMQELLPILKSWSQNDGWAYPTHKCAFDISIFSIKHLEFKKFYFPLENYFKEHVNRTPCALETNIKKYNLHLLDLRQSLLSRTYAITCCRQSPRWRILSSD
jgi:hypothetical protein